MSISKEEMQKYNEKANLKEVLQGGKQEGKNTIISEILAQDQYKQEIMDGLLQVRRTRKPLKTNDGELILQEFVRLEDKTGRWKKVSQIPQEKWEELKSGGVVNERGAKDILSHLNSNSNNNIALANLSTQQINNLGREQEFALHEKLQNNKEEYGIDDTDDITWIISSIIRPNIMANYSKAKKGGFIKELLRETKLAGSLDDEENQNNNFLDNYI